MVDRRVSIRLGLDDLDKVSVSLKKLGEDGDAALERITKQTVGARAALEQLQQVSQKTLSQQLDQQFNIGGDLRGRAADVAAYGTELDRLRAKYVPLFAAQQQYRSALSDLAIAERTGALAAGEAAAARDRIKAGFAAQVQGMKQVGNAYGLAGYQIANAGQQLQDIAVQLAGGQNPMLIMVQQVPQLTYALGGVASSMELVKKAAAGTFAFLASGSGLAGGAVAVAALGAAFLALGDNTDYAKKAAEQFKEANDRINNTLLNVKGGVLELAKAYANLTEEQKKSEEIDLTAAIRKNQEYIDTLRKQAAATAPKDANLLNYVRAGFSTENLLPTTGGVFPSIMRAQALDRFKNTGDVTQLKLDFNAAGFTGATDQLGGIESRLSEAVNKQGYLESSHRKLIGTADRVDNRILDGDSKSIEKSIAELDKYRAAWSETAAVRVQMKPIEDAYNAALDKGLISHKQYTSELAKARAEVEKSVRAKIEHTSSLSKYIEKLKEEAAYSKLSQRDQAVAKAVLEAQNAALRDHVKLSEADREAVMKYAAAQYDNVKAAEEHKKKMEELQHVVTRVTDSLTDKLVEMSFNGKTAFKDLKEYAISAFKEIAANAIIRPQIQSVVASLIGGGSGSLLSGTALAAASGASAGGGAGGGSLLGGLLSFGGSAYSALGGSGSLLSGLGGLSLNGIGASIGFANVPSSFVGPLMAGQTAGLTLGGLLGGAGLGFAGGSLLNGLVGGNSMGGSIGSGVGGLAGAAIGSIIPGVGTLLGGLIGGAGGGLLGGLFGPKKSVGPNANTNLNIRDGRLYVGETGADNGGDRNGTIQLAQQAVSAINGLIDAYGIKAYDPSGGQLGYTGLPHALGFEVYTGAANAGKPQTPDEVLAFMRRNGLLTGSGVTGTVLANSKATTVAGLSADLDVAKFIEDARKAATAIDSVAQQFVDLGKQADDYAKKAAQLGVASSQVYGALADQFNKQTKDTIKQLTDPLGFALDSFDQQAKAKLDYAKKIGADIVETEKLNGLQRAALLKQYGQQTIDDIKAWLEQQRLGATSSLSPVEKMKVAQSQFSQLVDTARAGGSTAGLTTAADTLLASSRDVLGGASAAYAEREASVRQLMNSLARMLAVSSYNNSAATVAAAANSSGAIPDWQRMTTYAFANGGSFMVGGRGGTDNNMVRFRASRDERVIVQTPEQQRSYDAMLRGQGQQTAVLADKLDRLNDSFAALSDRLARQQLVSLAG